MMTTKFYLLLGAGLLLLAASPTAAQARAAGPPTAPPAGSAAPDGKLAAQDRQKLKRRFDEADLDGNGSLTQDEARRAGFGFVAAHFSLIDTDKRGAVSFDQVMKFMEHMRKEAATKPI